jgi:GDP-L-fucose synthase
MSTIVLRPGNIYGPHDKFDPQKSKVIAALIRRIVERQNPMEVWGDGLDVKDFIYIDDVVDAIVASLSQLESFTTLNIASGKPVTIREVLSTMLRIEGQEAVEVRYDATKPTMIPLRLIDISEAARVIGFAPKVSLEDGLRRTFDWYRSSMGCLK